jgi:hypothetical protein
MATYSCAAGICTAMPDDGHFKPEQVAKVILNNFKLFLTNCVVRGTVFTNK